MLDWTSARWISGVLAVEDCQPQDVAPVATPPPNVADDELAKIGYPEIQGDVAPSAVVPKATQALTKTASKLDGVLATFNAIEKLTPLQQRTPDEDAISWIDFT